MTKVEDLSKTAEGLKKILSHHVVYEVDMLSATYVTLLNPYLGKVPGNAFIESFCTHARNLIDFFSQKKFVVDYVAAARFAKDTYEVRNLRNTEQRSWLSVPTAR